MMVRNCHEMTSRRRTRALWVLVSSVLLTLGPGIPTRAGALPGDDPGADNGYVLMVHGWFEPYPEGAPHALGPVLAVRDADHVTFSAIPYSVAGSRPVVVGDPRLEIVGLDTGDSSVYAPNVTSDNPVCRRETGFEGHEGPLAACPTFRVPASAFGGAGVAVIFFHFTVDARRLVEAYDVTNHTLLHGHLQAGAPEDLSVADRSSHADPFLVEYGADPLP